MMMVVAWLQENVVCDRGWIKRPNKRGQKQKWVLIAVIDGGRVCEVSKEKHKRNARHYINA